MVGAGRLGDPRAGSTAPSSAAQGVPEEQLRPARRPWGASAGSTAAASTRSGSRPLAAGERFQLRQARGSRCCTFPGTRRAWSACGTPSTGCSSPTTTSWPARRRTRSSSSATSRYAPGARWCSTSTPSAGSARSTWSGCCPATARRSRDTARPSTRCSGFYARRQDKLLAALDGGPRTPVELSQALFGPHEGARLYLTLSEVVGNLEVLEDACRVRRLDDGPVDRWALAA